MRRAGLEAALPLEPAGEPGVVEPGDDLAAEDTDALSQLRRSRRPLPPPEGHDGRIPPGRADHHLVGLDRLDPPGVIPQREGLADPPFEHELLVELAEAGALLAEEDGIMPEVGDRPTADQ